MAHKILLGVRWLARITGLLFVALVLVFMVGEGPPNQFKMPPLVLAEFFAMFLMLTGFLLGWRWEALARIIHKCGTNVPPVAFMVLAHKHFNTDAEARDGFAFMNNSG